MNNQVTVNKYNVLNAYKNASCEQMELLESLFGKDMFHPKDIRESIKTFTDAFYHLGDKNELVKEYKNLIVVNCMSKDIIAYAKLRIIAEALNEGWKPTFDEYEYTYSPSFILYNKDEYKKLNADEKNEGSTFMVGKSNKKSHCGNVYAIEVFAPSYNVTNNCSRFLFKTRELAEYCGNQFINIWLDFLFA